MTIENNEIHLNSIDTKIAEAQKLVKEYCGDKDLVEDLLTMRKEEVLTEAATDTTKESAQQTESKK